MERKNTVQNLKEDTKPLAMTSVKEAFDLSIETLSKLVDPKNPELLVKLGGVNGIAESLRVNLKAGLPLVPDETEQQRTEKYGTNVLPKQKMVSLFSLIFEALKDKVMLLLICAAVISVVLGVIPYTSEDPEFGWIEGVAILIAVAIVVMVSSLNDLQKQKQFAKLNDKKNDRLMKVLRDGTQQQVSVFDVRVGDIMLVDTGDIICADGVYVEGHCIKCDESTITGESDPIKKGHIESGLDPFFISGSQVIEGFGRIMIIAVGVNSFSGRTMMALQVPDEETPLQQKLSVLASTIGKFGLGAAILLILIVIPKYFIERAVSDRDLSGTVAVDIVRYIISAVTIVVVAVPEGLPLAVTMALAYSMLKMLKDNNLVRHLAACETMGGATNICSDKTGTLTQNVMTVVMGWVAGLSFEENEELYSSKWQSSVITTLCEGMAINSSAFETRNAKGTTEFMGSKTESALLQFGAKLGYDYQAARKTADIVQLYPFSSARKRMSVLIRKNKGYRLYCKGASEIILEMCHTMLVQKGDRVEEIEIDATARELISNSIHSMASDALRTLCLAYKDFDQERDWSQPPEDRLVLIAVVGIRDPLRPEVPSAVKTCQAAGITVRMVTGDNLVTAENIAKKCGILTDGGIAMEGPKFRELTPKEMDRIIPNLKVLARSSPTDKQILVKRLRDLGEVVAVTGDGTNDGPALKMADIGFSMGISGTEIAIAASDVVLLDDNFASIVKAVLWGRNVFDAIRKFLQFQLTVNVVAVTIAFVGTITSADGHGHSPLTAVQLLWVNLIMDTLAALALATEQPTNELLLRKPYGRHTSLITPRMWRHIIGHSAFQLLANFILLYVGPGVLGLRQGGEVHYTMVFNTFVFMQIFNEVNSRKLGDEKNVFSGLHKNRIFIAVLIGTCIAQALIVEFGGRFTSTTHLTAVQWLICVVIGAIGLPINFIIKLIPIPVSKRVGHSNNLGTRHSSNMKDESVLAGSDPAGSGTPRDDVRIAMHSSYRPLTPNPNSSPSPNSSPNPNYNPNITSTPVEDVSNSKRSRIGDKNQQDHFISKQLL